MSPLDSVEEVEQLIKAGADEFYCGFMDERWYERYPVISVNRRPAGKGHFKRFKDLKKAVAISHTMGVPVFFTVNEHYYIDAQYTLLREYIDNAWDAGVDALIVSDYGLMAYLRDKNYSVPIHVSTGGTVFNWRAVQFFKNLGAKRVTLPRHLTIKEIEDILKNISSIEITVFILNSRCINIDGFCTFQHGLARREIFPMFRNACMLPFNISAYCQTVEKADTECLDCSSPVLMRQKIWEKIHVDDFPCGACAMYEFNRLGIHSLKIVGRGNPMDRKLNDVRFLYSLRQYLEKEKPSRGIFRKEVRRVYSETFLRPCRIHLCYYPEVITADALDS